MEHEAQTSKGPIIWDILVQNRELLKCVSLKIILSSFQSWSQCHHIRARQRKNTFYSFSEPVTHEKQETQDCFAHTPDSVEGQIQRELKPAKTFFLSSNLEIITKSINVPQSNQK